MSDSPAGSSGPGTDGAPAPTRRGRRVRPGAVPDARPVEPAAPAAPAAPSAPSEPPVRSAQPVAPTPPGPSVPSAPSVPSFDAVLASRPRRRRNEVFEVRAAPVTGSTAAPVHPGSDGVGAVGAPTGRYVHDTAVEQVPVEPVEVEQGPFHDLRGGHDGFEQDGFEHDGFKQDAFEQDAFEQDGVGPLELGDELHPGEEYAGEGYVDEEEGLVEEHDLDADDDARTAYRDVRRPRRRGRTAVALVVCLALLGGAVYAGWAFLSPIIDRVSVGEPPAEDYPGPGTGEVDVVVEPGDTGGAIGDALVEAGVVASRAAFVSEFTATPEAAALQPGTYRLRQEMRASDALALLLDPAARRSIQVGVREGLWVSEMLPAISAETGFTVEELQAALADPAVGLPPESGGDPEGYLFPATYDFEPDVTPVEIFAAMVERHRQAMDDLGVPAEQRRDVLIRASIIQGEASRAEDLPLVARVIQNRLDRGETLGMDSTVGYAVQKRNLDLTASDLETDSPYNTRINAGLPPGPINNPGEAAIAAALAPAEGDWLYFVTVNGDTGETVFTADYDEFLAAKEQFQQWLAENG